MDSSNKEITHYLHFGAPYIKSVTLPSKVSTGNIVVGGITYTIGTDIFLKTNQGETVDGADYVKPYADGINGNSKTYNLIHKALIGNNAAYAKSASENKIIVIGRAPGDDFTLTSTISGAVIATDQIGDSGSGGGAPITSPALGDPTDAPATTPTDATAATMISLLKKIANAQTSIELAGDLYMTVDELEDFIGDVTSAIATSPVQASASLNQLLRAVYQETERNNIEKIDRALDRVEALVYLDIGHATDERLSTITVSSAALGRKYVRTYTFAGTSSPDYRATAITTVESAI